MKNRALCLTLGDPNAIGPELVCRLFTQEKYLLLDRPVIIIGPEQALQYYCDLFGLPRFWEDVQDPADICENTRGIFCYTPARLDKQVLSPGRESIKGGIAAGDSLEKACEFIENNLASGLITCPLNKATLIQAGYNFSGHTEFLAQRFGIAPEDVCMHLAGPRLRVSLLTRHCSLKQVPEIISMQGIERCLELTWDLVQGLQLANRPIAVCGLNPHAGEGGNIGDEEERIIIPAIKRASYCGIAVQGPFPADTVFYRAWQGEFPAVLAMYHDQGLAPLKTVHFQDAINITLGLPFVRTSVDHGTAYDLAGKKQADYTSLKNAVNTAHELCET